MRLLIPSPPPQCICPLQQASCGLPEIQQIGAAYASKYTTVVGKLRIHWLLGNLKAQETKLRSFEEEYLMTK